MIFNGSDLDLTCLQHHARLEIHEGQLLPKAKLLPYCESTLAVEPTLAMIATASQPDLARVVLSADSQTLFLRYESGDCGSRYTMIAFDLPHLPCGSSYCMPKTIQSVCMPRHIIRTAHVIDTHVCTYRMLIQMIVVVSMHTTIRFSVSHLKPLGPKSFFSSCLDMPVFG